MKGKLPTYPRPRPVSKNQLCRVRRLLRRCLRGLRRGRGARRRRRVIVAADRVVDRVARRRYGSLDLRKMKSWSKNIYFPSFFLFFG